MDSISQAALGATVAVIASRGKSPRRAIVYGAALGTLPDLDVLVSYSNDLLDTIKHRTWSHSWIVHLFLSPVLAWLIHRFDKTFSFRTWLTLVMLCLFTHAGLDAMTVYGTDLFWPVSDKNVMIGSIFIIDPLFTLPLVISLIFAWKSQSLGRTRLMTGIGVTLSSAYLVWGLWAQNHVLDIAESSLHQQGQEFQQILATPAPFNSVLWRVLAINGDRYYEGFRHLSDTDQSITFSQHSRNLKYLNQLNSQSNWQQANNFNHGFNALQLEEGKIVLNDLRMGLQPYYFFRFDLAEQKSETEFIDSTPNFASQSFPETKLVRWLWARLTGATVASFSEF